MLDRLIEIIAATRTFELPDLDVPKAKAREALFQMLKVTSAGTLATAFRELPMDVLKAIVNIEFTGKKARERGYVLAQLMVTLIRISDHNEKYNRQMHHPRRKVVAIIEALVAAGETFDWTKAAKNGFTITPAKAGSKTTEAVDFFTGDTLSSLKRRMRGYDITPVAYKKLFVTQDAKFVDTEYSEKQRKARKTDGQVENAPRQRGVVLHTEEKRISTFIQEVKVLLSSIDAAVPQSRLLASVLKITENSSEAGMKRADVVKAIAVVKKVRETLLDVRTSKSNRLNITKAIGLLGKIDRHLNVIRSRPTEKPKRAKVEASDILRRLSIMASHR